MLIVKKLYVTEDEGKLLGTMNYKDKNNFVESKLPDYVMYAYGYYGAGKVGKDEQGYYVEYTTSDSCD